jgi:hypothetical protein
VRRRLAAYRLTRSGGALLFVGGAALIVLSVGPRYDQRPALIVIVIALACFLFGAASGTRSASFGDMADGREGFPRPAPGAGGPPDPPAEGDEGRAEHADPAPAGRHPGEA